MLTELNLAIVGHANVGKTSLLRTLTQDSRFGTIADAPGTTKHVEAITFTLPNNQKIIFYDTPGLEDSIALYDYVDDLNRHNPKVDGIDKLQLFLSSPEAEHQFEQEAKVIRQLLKSDAAIYVIDVREPVLDKYHDELAVLAYSDKPILAVFNYTISTSPYEADWKTLLARVGIHAIVRFDAVFPSIDGEYRLYQSLLLLIESAKTILNQWQATINQQRVDRDHRAKLLIADALIDITAYHKIAKDNVDEMITIMQNEVRQREQTAIDQLLSLYQFSISQQSDEPIPLIQGRFASDLFNREALKLMGIHLSRGMISGAAIGAGVDLAVGGMTLGSAALIGAAIGGLTQTAKYYGNRIKNKLSGYTKMTIDDTIICFFSLRLLQLQDSLNLRGHANSLPIVLARLDESKWKKGKLPKSLQIARVHPGWSKMIDHKLSGAAQRQEVLLDVANELD